MHEGSLFAPELTSDVPKITITGRSFVHIEQHKGIMTYQEDKVALHTALGLLMVCGKELRIKHYSSSEMVISGEITSMCFGGDKP